MSYEISAIIVLFLSLASMGFVLYRKIPLLVDLPETTKQPSADSFISRLKGRIKNIPAVKSFSSDVFLQRILSRIRILTLKTDAKTLSWLQNLREKAQKRKLHDDNYWLKIKKATKQEGKK